MTPRARVGPPNPSLWPWRRQLGVWGLILCLMPFGGAAETVGGSAHRLGDASAPIEHDYVGVAKCKSCHKKELMGDQIHVWREGPHRLAWESLKSPESLELAAELGLSKPPSESEECLACHVTAYGVPPERISRPLTQADGVQCESCHGPGRRYRKKKVMSDPERARENGLWSISDASGICQRCHNDQSPTFRADRFIREDGSTAGFDYDVAVQAIAHPIPEHVKGHYLELDAERKKAEKAARSN